MCLSENTGADQVKDRKYFITCFRQLYVGGWGVCVCVKTLLWGWLWSADSSEVLLFMQSHFIAGIKVGVGNDSGIIPVSSIGNGQDFDFDSAQGYIYYVEKINVSYDFSTFFSSPKATCLGYGTITSFFLLWHIMHLW